MRPPIVLFVACSLVLTLVPAGAASETVTATYALGGFRILGVGPSFQWGGDLTGDGEDDFGPYGGARLIAQTVYLNVVVSASDDVFGSNAALNVMMWEPENDEVVQEPHSSGAGCGVRALSDSPYASNEVSVHMFAVLITDDLETCGASAGTLSADFF